MKDKKIICEHDNKNYLSPINSPFANRTMWQKLRCKLGLHRWVIRNVWNLKGEDLPDECLCCGKKWGAIK